jgi:hypothetical protein
MTSIGYVHEKEWRSKGRCQDGHIEEAYRYSRYERLKAKTEGSTLVDDNEVTRVDPLYL